MQVRERQRQPEARGRTGATTTEYYAKLTANPNPSLIRDGNKAIPKRCVGVLYLRRRGNGGPAAWLGQERNRRSCFGQVSVETMAPSEPADAMNREWFPAVPRAAQQSGALRRPRCRGREAADGWPLTEFWGSVSVGSPCPPFLSFCGFCCFWLWSVLSPVAELLPPSNPPFLQPLKRERPRIATVSARGSARIFIRDAGCAQLFARATMWLTLYRHSVSLTPGAPVRSAFFGGSPMSFWSMARISLLPVIAALSLAPLQAQEHSLVLEHDGSTVMFEPYAPNIIRVTLSMQHDPAVAAPGYGFVAKPDSAGWTHATDDHGDTYRSSRLMVSLDASRHGGKPSLTQADIAKFFTGSTPGAHIRIATAGRRNPPGHGGMAAVRAQPQGRQRRHSLRQAPIG